ncbi:MAG: phosphatidylglycerophosphatase A [Alphaproteobacteria bacterium]|nr:phosphatidylglycerophosphatase A [Alphaproteobacteria bacterium]
MRTLKDRLAIALSTWFGAGLSPFAPGTLGSLGALPFAYLAQMLGGNIAVLAFAALSYGAGLWAARQYLRLFGGDDPREVVIDEVAGQSLLLAAFAPSWQAYAAGFVLFRAFDVLKPWPVSWADQKIKGAPGVMLDDVLAALYGIAALALLQLLGVPGVSLVF